MAKFFVGNEFPSFKPIKATPDKVSPLLAAKIAAKQTAVDAAVEPEKSKLIKELNYLKGVENHCVNNPEKALYFTKEQAVLVGLL